MNKSLRKLSFPYLLWILIFTVVPLLLVAFFALTAYDSNGNLYLTLDGFRNVFGGETVAFSFFGLSLQLPLYINVFIRSLLIAIVCTLLCLLLGYPAAWIMAKMEIEHRRGSSILLFLLVMPMWMNALLRTYAWLALLEPKGIVNNFLGLFGLGPVQFLYNDFGIGLGMVYNYLPFMVLPIYSVLVKISPSLLEAAADLGADPRRVMLKVVLPMSRPGILSGINMVLMPAMTTFLIPDLLGGGRYLLIGNAIERQYMVSRDYTTGSALSIVLLIFVLLSMQIVSKNTDPDADEGGLVA
ncbi:ABC transporter permease [Oscillospiraceae bacterium HV4-5-C5C]|nr:ABC transporter permease [Oscillospiraceae bacterium HV4-5-C5C]